MDSDHKHLRNGIELLFTLQLALEIMDDYKLKGVLKNKANMFKKELEKDLNHSYDRVYAQDPEMAMNCMNIKHRMISQIASLDEADCTVMSEYVNKFFENIDDHRQNDIIYMTKQD